MPALLGLAGFRGSLVPVYDFASLLGYPARARRRAGWSPCGDTGVALAFDAFEAHARVDRPRSPPTTSRRNRTQTGWSTSDGVRRVLRLSRVLEAIEARAEVTDKEREAMWTFGRRIAAGFALAFVLLAIVGPWRTAASTR